MSETINVKFDPATLPESAQQIPEVVEFAKQDVAFRCDVCRFWHVDGYRLRLIDIAKSVAYGPDRAYWPR